MTENRSGLSALHEEEHENTERWLLTYADMITLLLALFMVLFALSSVSRNKFAAFKSGLVSAFHSSQQSSPTLPGGQGLLQQTSLTAKPAVIAHPGTTSLAKVEAQLRRALRAKGETNAVGLDLTPTGLTIRVLTDKVFFPSGSSGLEPAGRDLVDTIGSVLRRQPNLVQVRGYTDNVPIGNSEFGNFALSASRADAVLQRLITHDGVPMKRLSSAGFGPNRPVATNRTPHGRSLNRRVDIVVLNGTEQTS